jgi:hypothetical protein
MRTEVFALPPDCPKTMTVWVSPPKFSMLSHSRSSEATRSIMPALPARANSGGAQVGEMEVSKPSVPVVHGDHDHIAEAGERLAALERDAFFA